MASQIAGGDAEFRRAFLLAAQRGAAGRSRSVGTRARSCKSWVGAYR